MKKIERNDPCPCGSGKKYKQCCMKQEATKASSRHVHPNEIGQAVAHHQAGRLTQAEEIYQHILTIAPDHLDALNLLGVIAHQTARYDMALALFGKVLALKPDFADAHNNLGLVYKDQGKMDQAVVHYRLAVLNNPNFFLAHSNLGFALQLQGKLDDAITHYQKSLSLNPHLAETHSNCAAALQAQGKLEEAVKHYQKALAINPNFSDAHSNLGVALRDLGQLTDAIQHFRKALLVKPDYIDAYSNLLCALNFDANLSRHSVYEDALGYERVIGYLLRSTWQPHSNDKNPTRRLRIGYVSPDFRNHAVAYFAEPILSNHDKTQVEVFCYAEVMLEDDVTRRLQTYADHWHSTVGLSDETMAQLIREHQIDILIDLAGHTAKNRLPVFARKPAPIQMTYLGYPGTSGLSAMDYRITDVYADPEGIADAYYSEKLLRLPHSLCCYHPSADMPEVTPLPALERGYMTFGSFNNFNKIDQATLELWSAMLRSIPTARLMMLTVPEGEVRQQLTNRFAALGIEAHRLTFHGKLPGVAFHRKFLEVDISLDSMTVSGGTTTCESLWMGVPVIAFVGDRFITRVSYSFLNTVGFSDFAVETPEAFLHLTQHLANNLPLLAGIRQELREHLRSSPLVDEQTFTRNLQALYRDAWNKWCNA